MELRGRPGVPLRMPLPILDDIRIASPCDVPWGSMTGDERVRHCAECDLDVFNLASLTRAEAEALVFGREGRTCVRLFRRFDGTVVTRDCPVGWRKVRRAARRRVMLAAIFVLATFGVGGAMAARQVVKQCDIDDGSAFDSPLLVQILALVKGQPPVIEPGRMVIPHGAHGGPPPAPYATP